MNINDLPDDCLLYIFNLFGKFEPLLNSSRVCRRWKYLVRLRVRPVEHLNYSFVKKILSASKTLIFDDYSLLEQINVSEWFPKLKIFVDYARDNENFIGDLKMKGLILFDHTDGAQFCAQHHPSLEMLATTVFSNFTFDFSEELIQLFLELASFADLAEHVPCFPNLRRLHIDDLYCEENEEEYFDGPVLEKLEILEITHHFETSTLNYCGFSLADMCPVLKSAFFGISTDQIFLNHEIKNEFLEDLVIHWEEFPTTWKVVEDILRKYPNLKHLAIRGKPDISDNHVLKILKLLRHIILIDLRDSIKVTDRSAAYIKRYCRQHKRSIFLYYQNNRDIKKDWPHLLTECSYLGSGFDFMKNCFFKEYYAIPFLFVDPD